MKQNSSNGCDRLTCTVCDVEINLLQFPRLLHRTASRSSVAIKEPSDAMERPRYTTFLFWTWLMIVAPDYVQAREACGDCSSLNLSLSWSLLPEVQPRPNDDAFSRTARPITNARVSYLISHGMFDGGAVGQGGVLRSRVRLPPRRLRGHIPRRTGETR